MSLSKTEMGKDALQRRDPSLSPRERQIIVLANGVLTSANLGKLMQHDIHAEVELLIQRGYLTKNRSIEAISPAPLGSPPSIAADLAAKVGKEPTNPAAQTPAQPQRLGSRRSLAGTKMYIVDMLQLLRDMEASAIAVSIHTSQDEMEFIDNVAGAVRFIADKCGPEYGTRVIRKLFEIVPEAHLTALHALVKELEAVPTKA